MLFRLRASGGFVLLIWIADLNTAVAAFRCGADEADVDAVSLAQPR